MSDYFDPKQFDELAKAEWAKLTPTQQLSSVLNQIECYTKDNGLSALDVRELFSFAIRTAYVGEKIMKQARANGFTPPVCRPEDANEAIDHQLSLLRQGLERRRPHAQEIRRLMLGR